MRWLRWFAACLVASLIGGPALAQNFPARPITMVVPFPPGPLDVVARWIAPKLSDALGQPVVVDHRPGANGMVGSSAVSRAAPDGYTILAATVGTHVTAVHLSKNLAYDPVNDFTPIAAAVEPVTCLVVNTALPVHSVDELVAYAKARPGELSYGTSGVGSMFHLLGELLNQTAGIRLQQVPYRGVGPAMQDVLAGHIPITFTSVSTALPNLDQGRIRILAVLEPTRYPRLPDVPSITEVLPAFRKPSGWFGFLGPPGLPPEVVARLNAEIVKALNSPDVRPKVEGNGYAVIGGTPEEFRALIRDGIERFGTIIKAAGIEPQ
ncbi:MAG TPA: tripartite tricarboxylate transporter substrate binding protein [Xanthobacteraceae bacterium]|nr:tripartite tricarboxylate transporter substrate binding protein [Xanthobacteraceae bacterium]